MIRFTTGDMFNTPADLRVNTVNCVGVMGAGVAAAFKKRYPEMFRDYERECDAGRVQPGKLHVWKTLTGEWIINFPTKRHWRDKSRYEDIEAGLLALKAYLDEQDSIKVTLPALGCGHGGLDWGRVAPMIERYLGSVKAEIAVFTPQDSHLHARQEIEKELGAMHTISAGSEGFPVKLRDSDVREIYSAGSFGAKAHSDIAIALSPKPTPREEKAALSVVQELARPGIFLAMTAGSSAANTLASTALAQGAKVSFWVSEGLARYRLPSSLKSAFAEGNLSLFSVARAEQGWNPRLAAQNSVASLSSSSATVITDPHPSWLSAIASDALRDGLNHLFYLRYQGADQESESRWSELAVIPIGRRSSDGKPNVAPLLEVLDTPRTETKELPNKSVDSGQHPVDSGKPLVQESASVTKSDPKPYPKRLIEVDLPIKRISAHARHENSVRHGHFKTLHMWWARRPLAACRAVICASLWPDPVDANCPPAFRVEAAEQLHRWAREQMTLHTADSASTFSEVRGAASPTALAENHDLLRRALFDFLADFADWERATKSDFLSTARALVQAAHEALGGTPGTHPRVFDPFAGGGSIPLEALRVGADSCASDLNPVAVLLNRMVLDSIPRYGTRLADTVREVGERIKVRATEALTRYYPRDADGSTPITYLWARTVISEAPLDYVDHDGNKVVPPKSEDEPFDGLPLPPVEIPLIRGFWLAKKKGRFLALRWLRNKNGIVQTEVATVMYADGTTQKVRRPLLEIFHPKVEADLPPATVQRGSATCPVTGHTTPVKRVRAQLKPRRGGSDDARLLAVATLHPATNGRNYRLANATDEQVMMEVREKANSLRTQRVNGISAVPDEKLSFNELRRISIPIYGMMCWGDLFSSRQLVALTTLRNLIVEESQELASKETPEFALAVRTALAFALSKQTDLANALCPWEPTAECPRHLFSRQAVPFVWDFAEGIPIGESSGSWSICVDRTGDSLAATCFSAVSSGQVIRCSATAHWLPDDSAQLFFTDPPYYDAVPYAYLSDFFYVWLRRCLADTDPEMARMEVVPKDEEIVVDRPHELSNSTHDIAFYERELCRAFAEAHRVLAHDGIGSIVFASKTTASWEAILGAVINAGWVITASWPIDTEMETRVSAQGQARLASSVHLVVRPREAVVGANGTSAIGDWRDVLQELPRCIHEWMPRLAKEGVVGADAIFACLGPALEIFSRYSRVEKASGEQVTLRDYLEHVWAAVSREALSSLISGTDLSSLEADARITAMWLWTLNAGKTVAVNVDDEDDEGTEEEEDGGGKKPAAKGGYSLEYDAARKIAQGLGASLDDLKTIIEVKSDQARLLPVSERTAHLFGKEQAAAPGASIRAKKKANQMDLFAEMTGEAGAAEAAWEEKTVSKLGETVLDRVHQAMILFAAGRGDALKRFVVDDGVGQDPNFWRLAQALSALYPSSSQEKRWVDGVLARKKGLGL